MNHKRRIWIVLAAIALSLGLSSAPSRAQPAPAWPQRPVKFILPLGPGAGVDIGARLIADKLSAKWGQPVVIENRPGGDGIVAISAFIGANDDHVLLLTPTSMFTAHPYLHDKVPYDPAMLSPIARISTTIVGLAVPESSPYRSLSELLKAAREQPGKLNWATTSGLFDFAVGGYLKKEGIEIARVPYRDAVQGANDLGEGRIQLMVVAIASLRPQVQAGKARIIVVTSSERASIAPDIPTTTEAGYPELAVDGLIGLFGPRDMPQATRDRIAADIKTAISDPTITSRFNASGQVVNPGTSVEFATAIEKQKAQAANFAKILNIKAAQ